MLGPSSESRPMRAVVNENGIAVHTASELIENLELSFKQKQKAGLKLSIENSQIGDHSIRILGKTTSTAGFALIEERITKFLKNLKVPNSVKILQRFLRFLNLYRQYIPTLANRLVPLHLLLRKDVSLKSTKQYKDAIIETIDCLLKAWKLSVKMPLPEQQLVIMCEKLHENLKRLEVVKSTLFRKFFDSTGSSKPTSSTK